MQTSDTKIKHMPMINDTLRIFYLLISVSVCVFWVMQHSINAYWQQTYHTPSPLTPLDRFSIWKFGDSTGLFLKNYAAYGNNTLYDLNVRVNDYVNHCCLSDTVEVPAVQDQILAIQAKPVIVADPNMIALTTDNEVFFGGDSLMQGVAPIVQKKLLSDYQINTINLSKQSTGLSYSSFFDWPKTVEQALIDHPKISLVVMFLGPNDPWDIPDPENKGGTYIKFQSPRWESIYREKIKRIITATQQHQAKLIWLGPPNMKKDKLNQQMIYLMSVIEDEVGKNHAIYVDTREILGNKNNVFSDSVINNEQQKTKVRSGDGIHFSSAGVKILAENIESHIQFTPAVSTPSVIATTATIAAPRTLSLPEATATLPHTSPVLH